MPRYIDADKLYEEMQYGILHEHYDKPFDLLAEILEAPTADVRENVRGEWIHQAKFGRIECDQCGKVYRNTFAPKNFCPNCGADMREEEEDVPMEYYENGGI